jgi:UDP-N-acetylmuramoylalanine-D-glutamate ligase
LVDKEHGETLAYLAGRVNDYSSQPKKAIVQASICLRMHPSAKSFVFRDCRFEARTGRAYFRYRIEFKDRAPLDFTETLALPVGERPLTSAAARRFLEPLHLILGISYFKLYCPPVIKLAKPLAPEQAEFWNTVYRKGLGEFLYRNRLDPKKLAKFPASRRARPAAPARVAVGEDALLGIGGGKDSIVAAELLRGYPFAKFTSYLLETQRPDPVAAEVMDALGAPQLVVRRTLDTKIFQPHEGAYNGHVPISAVFAFTGLFAAALTGRRYIIVGNEHSSNYGNLKWRGEEINHQWSKSAEFEMMLQEYARRFITPDVTYFSLLRQFYELRIIEMFSKYPQYFRLFTSCNRNFRVHVDRPATRWCGECPKCAFMFLMLAPFLPKGELLAMFGRNLLDDATLLSLYRDLLGFGAAKPFDCVGTFEEARAALYLAAKKYAKAAVVQEFLSRIEDPEALVKQVFRAMPAPTLPTPFRLLGVKNVALLGYGNEGRVNEAWLKQYFPALKIGILDAARDPHYLDHQEEYDLAVKTPGLNKNKVRLPYVTGTNLFFALNRNYKIGVTGSKGKSTTATLIYEMLKAGGKKVRLIGNIGSAMLGTMLGPVDSEEIFVIEMSSYMLDDIEHSPSFAVLLNLFPEHMDYHGGVEPYYAAKRRIFKFQPPGAPALFGPQVAKLPLKRSEIPLAGPHNLRNVKVAVKVARAFGVRDAAIRRALKNFRPLPHRLEKVGTFRGITFYDDAISTTPQSTMMALKSMKGVATIFLGGSDRGYDFRELEKALRTARIKNLVLFPDTGARILKSRRGFNILETRSMPEAVAFAYAHTPPGKICLLSTASPSYSNWKNFEAKGDEFKKYVLAGR